MSVRGSNKSIKSVPRPSFKGDPAYPEGMSDIDPGCVRKPNPRRLRPGYEERLAARKAQPCPAKKR